MELIKVNDKYYQLKRIIKKEYFKTLEDVKIFKEYLHCNHVMQDQENYMFCITVDDVEFEIINGDIV